MIACAEAGDPGGSLMICGSLLTFSGVPTMSHYCAAKGAFDSMSRALVLELAPHGIRINVVAPGFIITEMVEAAGLAALLISDMFTAKTPLGHEAAGVVVAIGNSVENFAVGTRVAVNPMGAPGNIIDNGGSEGAFTNLLLIRDPVPGQHLLLI